jgi:hypothetical protein
MQSKATTVDAYLAKLPEDRRAAISAVREVILANLDRDYEEGMQYGMIGYYVPHRVFAAGYHCDPKQPLPFAGLASQKNHMSLYLMGVYCGCDGPGGETNEAKWFREAWAKTGKKLDMGKACLRFKKIENVALEVVGEAIRRVPAKLYLKRYEQALAGTKRGTAAKKAAAKKPARKRR